MANLASTYWNQGRWKEAEQIEIQVMETRKQILGPEHPSTLNSMANLAFTWKSLGKEKDAVLLMTNCVQLRTQHLGPNHPRTISSMTTLAKWQETDNSSSNKCSGSLTEPEPEDQYSLV